MPVGIPITQTTEALSRGVVDGASYTDVNAELPALNLLVLISAASFVLFIVNIWRRGWVLPILTAGVGWVVSGWMGLAFGLVAGVLIWSKLRLATNIPRSAYAVPGQGPVEDAVADVAQSCAPLHRPAVADIAGCVGYPTLHLREVPIRAGAEHARASLREVLQLVPPRPSARAVRNLSCPVTLVVGDIGEPVFRRTTTRVHGLLPDAQLAHVAQTSHLISTDQPRAFAEIVAETLGLDRAAVEG